MKFLEDVALSRCVARAKISRHRRRTFDRPARTRALRPRALSPDPPGPARRPFSKQQRIIFRIPPSARSVTSRPPPPTPPSPPLRCRLNAFLSAVNLGEYVVHGQLEAYSCASPGYSPAPAPSRRPVPRQQAPRVDGSVYSFRPTELTVSRPHPFPRVPSQVNSPASTRNCLNLSTRRWSP